MLSSIRWRVAVPYALLILAAAAGLSIYVPNVVRAALMTSLQERLTAEARLLADALEPSLGQGTQPGSLNALAQRWSASLDARVTILRPDGVVLGESSEDRTAAADLWLQPEVQQALAVGVGVSTRFSQTVTHNAMYAAVAVTKNGQVLAIVRVGQPLNRLDTTVAQLRRMLVLSSIMMVLLAVLVSFPITVYILRPVRRLNEAMRHVGEGELDNRVLSTSQDEIGRLVRAFNRMADQLQVRTTALAEERSRLAVVLEHMPTGILIADDVGEVQFINPAAARFLGTTPSAALGRSIARVVRHHQLIELWKRCRGHGDEKQVEETVELERQRLYLRVIVTSHPNVGPQGCLIILEDLTRMRRLETVRRDFISNISHELRTPLASLKALVDTLRDGALDDPPAAQRFLDRIETEVDALAQMVQELLELSRIESGQVPLRLHPTPLADVVLPPLERLLPQAERASLRTMVDLPADLPPVLADAERAQQVVTNLLHNAIKFTPAGGRVEIVARAVGDEVVVSVRDTGVGIPAYDLPRIFERFYKADRARSSGGTGLGLAIAKHIVQAHAGRIWAESVEGKGSTFYFSLPAAQDTFTSR